MLLVTTTFVLVVAGGTVTSKGAGLAVPDYPTTFGYNMFAVPFDQWIGRGGIFWEHLHRLIGSFVGMLSIVMMVWLWLTQRNRRWLRWTGVALLVAVIVQGLMGGLRVTEISLTLAIVHGITAQLFLCLTVFLAAATSRFWMTEQTKVDERKTRNAELRYSKDMGTGSATGHSGNTDRNSTAYHGLANLLLVTLLIQLVLGANVRHLGAGLAIPDFPLSFDRLLPPFDQAGIIKATDAMMIEYSKAAAEYATVPQVALHFAHRVWSLIVFIIAGSLLWRLWASSRQIPLGQGLIRPSGALAVLLIVQMTLGIAVVTSGRQTAIATAHQTVGATLLATAFLLAIRIHLLDGRRTGESIRYPQIKPAGAIRLGSA